MHAGGAHILQGYPDHHHLRSWVNPSVPFVTGPASKSHGSLIAFPTGTGPCAHASSPVVPNIPNSNTGVSPVQLSFQHPSTCRRLCLLCPARVTLEASAVPSRRLAVHCHGSTCGVPLQRLGGAELARRRSLRREGSLRTAELAPLAVGPLTCMDRAVPRTCEMLSQHTAGRHWSAAHGCHAIPSKLHTCVTA